MYFVYFVSIFLWLKSERTDTLWEALYTFMTTLIANISIIFVIIKLVTVGPRSCGCLCYKVTDVTVDTVMQMCQKCFTLQTLSLFSFLSCCNPVKHNSIYWNCFACSYSCQSDEGH